MVYAGLLILALSAWAYMAYMGWAMQNMHLVEMWMPPSTESGAWRPYDFFMLFLMWAVMMIAMMTPSVMPMVSLFVTVSVRNQKNNHVVLDTFVFVSGYLLSWIFFSVLMSAAQYPLHLFGWLNPMMDSRSYLFSGSILLIAGLYQWTPLKDACLTQCRTPLQFLMTRWRNGTWGAMKMGMAHGTYCVGCCWALMAVMFSVGVMSVFWMVVIAFFVLAEKISPYSAKVFRTVSGLGLVTWGSYWLSKYPW